MRVVHQDIQTTRCWFFLLFTLWITSLRRKKKFFSKKTKFGMLFVMTKNMCSVCPKAKWRIIYDVFTRFSSSCPGKSTPCQRLLPRYFAVWVSFNLVTSQNASFKLLRKKRSVLSYFLTCHEPLSNDFKCYKSSVIFCYI